MTHAPHSHRHEWATGELPVMDEAFWDARYREAPAIWSGNPNPQLVAEVADLTPGTALDVGSGEGGDAIWLAQRGWQVTAADLSTVALERAAGHAEAAGVAERITWLHVDFTAEVPAGFDLVSAQFMQLPSAQVDVLQRRLAAAVNPGGTLLVVGHDFSDTETTIRRPKIPDMFYTAADVAARLDPDGWEVLVAEARPRQAPDADGTVITIHDAVLRARRLQNRS
jgi:2-polyprenyl-3-methyl-5-hydroxy-6-metoxy-1,4-benzoquinol methylase